MTPLDPRDVEYAERIGAALIGMIVAVHRDDPERATAELGKLLAAIVAHKHAMSSERLDDAALVRAVAALNRTEHAG